VREVFSFTLMGSQWYQEMTRIFWGNGVFYLKGMMPLKLDNLIRLLIATKQGRRFYAVTSWKGKVLLFFF